VIGPRAVVFDWDNTLVDSWDTIHDAMHHCFTQMGHEPWTLAEVKARTRLSLIEAFPPIFGDRWQEARRHYFERFHQIHLERIKPLPGVVAMLDGLAALGLPLAVVSNKTGATLRKEAAHFGWTPRFVKLVGAGDAALDKPAAAPILMALEAVGMPPGDRVWYIGDTGMDMQCAANAGCRGVLLHEALPDDPLLEQFAPAGRFANCDSLLTHIKAL
jgi:phosphoglycolate phosphatase